MAKLSHDYIRFVLQMDASQHEQEIRKLTKNTQSLKEENKQLKKSMADLTATGKRNTEPKFSN